MKIEDNLSDSKILQEIGHRMAQARLEKNMTQGQLAHESGLAVRTIRRLESGEVATQLTAFVRVCRVLRLLGNLERLVPEPVPSPIAQLKLRGKRRQRASSPRTATKPPAQPWRWGDAP